MERIKNLMNAGDLLEDDFVETELVEDDDDRDMVIGIAELLRMIEDEANRRKIAKKVMRDFDRDNVTYIKDEFLKSVNL
jgi:hypothetical protein